MSEAIDPAPFDLAADGRSAALCLHGLTGTPYEVRPLGEVLARRGVRALGPALPGHNQTPQALATRTHSDWLDAARGHLRELRARHEQVFVVGMSMGGLLGLSLAAEGGVDALVVIGVPLYLRQPIAMLLPLLGRIVPFAPKRHGSDIRDPAARRRHPGYDVMPLASVCELQRLQRRVRGELERVTAPTLVAHGARDRAANPADAREIHAGISSQEKELLILEASGHVVPVDYDGPRLANAVSDFLGGRV